MEVKSGEDLGVKGRENSEVKGGEDSEVKGREVESDSAKRKLLTLYFPAGPVLSCLERREEIPVLGDGRERAFMRA